MANGVLMPKAGITVESCIIGKWKKAVGDHVAMGEILFDYETDKASFECESTAEGELLEIFFQDGDEVPCLVNVCAIGAKGEDCSALRPDGAAPAAPAPQEAPATQAAPAPAAAPAAGTKVTAPMPGTVLKVVAAEGAAVKAGDVILVLEAMKMENDIVAPENGTVKQLLVSKGSTVNTDDVLAVLG